MIYVPPISDYKPFYIQFGDSAATDLIGAPYYVIVKTHGYPPYKVREPYKHTWLDEHGDEEYIGATGLYVESFDLSLECVMFAKRDNSQSDDALIADLRGRMWSFREALRSAGFVKIYDAYTGYGFGGVRLSEFPSPGEDAYRLEDGKVRLIFSMTFRVTEPRTLMGLSNGYIVQA